jgi:hypothetical protein
MPNGAWCLPPDLFAPLARLAAATIEEAREIAARLRCQPLLDRAAALAAPDSPTLTPQDSPSVTR